MIYARWPYHEAPVRSVSWFSCFLVLPSAESPGPLQPVSQSASQPDSTSVSQLVSQSRDVVVAPDNAAGRSGLGKGMTTRMTTTTTTMAGPSDARPANRDEASSETLETELADSLRDLQEVVEADPLNSELQRARYDVYLALCSCQADLGRDVRSGVYVMKMTGISGSVKRKRVDGADAVDAVDDVGDRINAMHAKNLYSRRRYAPDFLRLASQYPVLKPHLVVRPEAGRGPARKTPRATYNFKSWEACRDLAAVLFEHDFGVRSWTVPKPHLVPPLANRLNYLCYVHDLLESDGRDMNGSTTGSGRIRILDVGCGANLVYPLLAASYFGWASVGCDVNEAALRHAARLRDANPDIAPLMVLRHAAGLHVLEDEEEAFDAIVCNPPFFDRDAGETAGGNPRTEYGGTEAELWCAGGEEAFVVGMIRESTLYRGRHVWFSSMCGKKKTLKDAKAELARLDEAVEGVTYRIHTLQQGSTTRWVIAWRW